MHLRLLTVISICGLLNACEAPEAEKRFDEKMFGMAHGRDETAAEREERLDRGVRRDWKDPGKPPEAMTDTREAGQLFRGY